VESGLIFFLKLKRSPEFIRAPSPTLAPATHTVAMSSPPSSSPPSSSPICSKTPSRVPSPAPSDDVDDLPVTVHLRKRKRVETDPEDEIENSSEDAEHSEDPESLGYRISKLKGKKRAAGKVSVSKAPKQSKSFSPLATEFQGALQSPHAHQ
jgi:hypothetical protein